MSSKTKKPTQLTCIIDRFEDSKAVLRFEFNGNDRQELVIAKRFLPKDIQEGEVLQVEFFSDQEAESRRRNFAREVLKEILQGE